jgi:inosine-uridine nucleoside N-ribohydrolase
MRNPVILDLAPGAYEALALYFAKRSGLPLRAVTVNSLFEGPGAVGRVLGLCGALGITAPGVAGAETPIIATGEPPCDRYPRPLPGLPAPAAPGAAQGYAWDVLYRQAALGPLDLICLGPLTNLAVALFKYPDLRQCPCRVFFYGGTLDWGNAGRGAEINMRADPHGADAVAKSAMDVTMVPWSATRGLDLADLLLPGKLEGAAAQAAEAILARERPPLEAALPLNHMAAVLLAGEGEGEGEGEAAGAFTLQQHRVRVETRGRLCMGRTCADLMYSLKTDPPTMKVVRRVDAGLLAERVRGLVGPAGGL